MRSQTAATYETLKNQLLDGHFEPGAKLKIDRVSSMCDASPGAVREALSRLTSEGLVVSVPQRGFMVAQMSTEDLLDLTEVRIDIEIKCLRRSIEYGDLAWEARIQSARHQLRHTPVLVDNAKGVNPEWSRAHIEFHDTLISACNSEWWLKLRNQMFMQAERYRRMLYTYAKMTRDIDAEHEAIVDATLARDADLACKLLAAHAQETANDLVASVAPLDAQHKVETAAS
ncbi:MAG: GntR family transcriptional regulator [Pseudomonadota bacterium]